MSSIASSLHSKSLFARFAKRAAFLAGTPTSFFIALVVVIVWAVTGPIFQYSDTWQLVINTGTTIITFLMVFLIQNAQNRDSLALHLKLDELIRASKEAQNTLMDIEELDCDELEIIRQKFEVVAKRARTELRTSGNFAKEFEVDKPAKLRNQP